LSSGIDGYHGHVISSASSRGAAEVIAIFIPGFAGTGFRLRLATLQPQLPFDAGLGAVHKGIV